MKQLFFEPNAIARPRPPSPPPRRRHGRRPSGPGHELARRVRATPRRAHVRRQRDADEVRGDLQPVQGAAGRALLAARARASHVRGDRAPRDEQHPPQARLDEGRGVVVGEPAAADARRDQGRAAEVDAGGNAKDDRAQGATPFVLFVASRRPPPSVNFVSRGRVGPGFGIFFAARPRVSISTAHSAPRHRHVIATDRRDRLISPHLIIRCATPWASSPPASTTTESGPSSSRSCSRASRKAKRR